jgi:hypothetical protein
MEQLVIFGASSLLALQYYAGQLEKKHQFQIENNAIRGGARRLYTSTPKDTSVPLSYQGRVSIPYDETYDYLKKQGIFQQYQDADEYFRTVHITQPLLDPQRQRFKKQYHFETELVK